MNQASKKRSSFEILGLRENEVSISKIESAYREKRKYLEEQLKESDENFKQTMYHDLEKAFEDVINFADYVTSNEDEADVIPATFLPRKKPKPKKSIDIDNIIYIHKEAASFDGKKQKEQDHISRPIDSLMTMKINTKRIKSKYSENPEYLKKIENMIENSEKINGKLLKQLREEMFVSLEEMSQRIKVSKIYLESIESDSYTQLPAEVYVRGFFNSYLHYLGLDRKDLVEALTEVYKSRRRMTKKK